MKKIFCVLFMGLLLASCNKAAKETQTSGSDSVSVAQKFVVDSVKVEGSVSLHKNLTALFSKQILVFPSIEDKVLLDSIYKEAFVESKAFDVASLKSTLEKEKQKYFDETKASLEEWAPDFEQTWDDYSGMKMISHEKDLLTLQYTGSGFSGGAHGYYYERYKSFDLKAKKVFTQNDIFKNPKDKNWDKILKNNFLEPEQKEMMLVDAIELNDNFFFDKDRITFVYNQYEITAYAAGVVEIVLKFKDIKDHLKPEFIKQFDIK